MLALPILVLANEGAWAQGIEVAPVSITFGPQQQTGLLQVNNRTTRTVVVQVRSFAWTEVGDETKLSPTAGLAVSPPAAELQPGQSQTIRLVLRQAPQQKEDTYRLLIDELPPPATSGTVRVTVRFSVPVFAEPDRAGGPDLVWQILVNGGSNVLSVENRGDRHARILSVELGPPGRGAIPVRTVVGPYVLPGMRRQWPLPAGARLRPGGPMPLRAVSDAGTLEANAPISISPP